LTLILNAALAYGGAAGVAIVHGLGIAPASEDTLSKIIVWIGMLLGALATAALMIILGAVVGALVYGLVGRRYAKAAEAAARTEQTAQPEEEQR